MLNLFFENHEILGYYFMSYIVMSRTHFRPQTITENSSNCQQLTLLVTLSLYGVHCFHSMHCPKKTSDDITHNKSDLQAQFIIEF